VTEAGGTGLLEVLDEAAARLEAVERRPATGGDAVEWSIGGRVFAAATSDRATFRLAPEVAAAALRTPDTMASDRGRDWVAFAPAEVDQYAIDRATAWLASAWRRADGES
jgi:hypothetical protein